MNKKILIVLFAALMIPRIEAKADEGMWLPFLIDESLFSEMKGMGLNLTREQVFSFTGSSIKDAIVSFGGGCTGEIISDKGLLLTNHHCGYGRIQALSSVENDYLKNGYWATGLHDELPSPGLFVRFLVQAEDVTDQMNSVLRPDMNEQERARAIRIKSDELVAAATRGTHYTANIRPMFAGNEFFLFVYETFNDVRLVGTPPEAIGAYGGDTDNWMWPRHTGDFALFRVYMSADGKPADYSPDNVPLKPRHHLPVSMKGVQENDFAMILGYPGSTNRYLTSYGIEFNLENMYPPRIDIRRKKLDIIEEAMLSSDEIRIKYASKQSSIANYWKNFIGMSRSLKRLNVADTKRELEREFQQWVNADPARRQEYGSVMSDYSTAYEGLKKFNSENFIFAEAIATGPDMIRFANTFGRLPELMKDKSREEQLNRELRGLAATVDRTFRNYDRNVDQQLLAAMLREYFNRIPAENLPSVFREIERKYKNDFDRYAADVYRTSIFADQTRLEKFLEKPSLKTLENDLMFIAARSLYQHNAGLAPRMEPYNTMIARAERLFLKGLREMKPDHSFYPDANGTMRFTYGTVGGYSPADAVYYDFRTTMTGVMEKEDPTHHEFVVPEKLKELYLSKNFGDYAENGVMVVNFLSNNDITGGNSGSPVINGDGHLIGLAFDGNWEAMSGDILFEHEMQRCINVDARYILFIIDKFAGARHLLDEMTIIR